MYVNDDLKNILFGRFTALKIIISGIIYFFYWYFLAYPTTKSFTISTSKREGYPHYLLQNITIIACCFFSWSQSLLSYFSFHYQHLHSVRIMAAMQASRKTQHLGETTWAKMPKVNAELFSLTYGAMVAQVTWTWSVASPFVEEKKTPCICLTAIDLSSIWFYFYVVIMMWWDVMLINLFCLVGERFGRCECHQWKTRENVRLTKSSIDDKWVSDGNRMPINRICSHILQGSQYWHTPDWWISGKDRW